MAAILPELRFVLDWHRKRALAGCKSAQVAVYAGRLQRSVHESTRRAEAALSLSAE
jgi:hypothetical protein